MDYNDRCIVFCVDENQTCNQMMKYSIQSIRKNNNVQIFYLTIGKNTNNHDAYRINIDEYFNSYFKDIKLKYKANCPTRFTYARLTIPLIPELKKFKKILYLDTDIECTKNIEEIFDIDLDGYGIGGVAESRRDSNPNNILNKFDKLNLKLNQEEFNKLVLNKNFYINAGVLLINNEELQKCNYFEKFKFLLNCENICDFVNHDQDIINVGFTIKEIPKKFNVYPNSRVINASFIHYICQYKSIFLKKYTNLVTNT